ncbi:hypothetical protein BC828DRAFT_441450 [Blastocladiella britannica]|nr:hypothetical protein BC828DRAFT_441450 [Blastocladiella britannica]
MEWLKSSVSACLSASPCAEESPQQQPAALPKLGRAIRDTVDATIHSDLNAALRDLSVQIHGHPELGYQEFIASELLSNYMEAQGFAVTREAFELETAFVAVFRHAGTRRGHFDSEPVKVGFCAEMDALPGLGHACGSFFNILIIEYWTLLTWMDALLQQDTVRLQDNRYLCVVVRLTKHLIAIAGVAAALAVKEAAVKHDLPVQVTLYGTPAEEGGGGKVRMLQRGAFVDDDICLMLHPEDGDNCLPTCLAMQWMEVTYIGKAAHAAASPWDGINALDALTSAFTNISHLRQQLLPTDRVHGIITNGGSKSNIIPDLTTAKFIARAPTSERLDVLVEKVVACFSAAAQSSGAQLDLEYSMRYSNLRSNPTLARLYQREMERRGIAFPSDDEMRAESAGSTDFGDVSHAVPGLQPMFSIGFPGVEVHTKPFVEAAGSIAAHEHTLSAAAGLASAALTVVAHPKLRKRIRDEFDHGTSDLTVGPIAKQPVSERSALLLASSPPPPYAPVV